MKLIIDNEAPLQIDKQVLKKSAEKIFKRLKINSSNIEVGLKITDNKEIKKINKKYREIDKATDVLSFPLDKPKKTSKIILLGDVVISKDYCQTKKDIEKLFLHGLMHLLGHHHK